MEEVLFNEVELEKLLILNQVRTRHLTQKEGALKLGLSDRQIRRLLNQTKALGATGIKPKPKGGNRAFDNEVKDSVITILTEFYSDYGPTLAAEKLKERHGLKVNKETMRQWMMEAGLWKGRARKKARIHQSRQRRSRFGEMVQIDGSHHDWFEGRAPKCCLYVFIDDATSRLLGLRFEKSETTLGYMTLMERYLMTYGRPVSFYSDKHSVFKTTREQNVDSYVQDTQLHRALRELGIELICAHSPQAKGRVERANGTLQDRLIKEMRFRNISSIEDANRYLAEFMEDYNSRFAVEASNPEDAHRILNKDTASLKMILSVQNTRKLTKNLEFSFNCRTYQIKTKTTGYRLRDKAVKICEQTDGTVVVLCDNEALEYEVFMPFKQIRMADCKEINDVVDEVVAANESILLAA
jgi:transposase InsO family protein